MPLTDTDIEATAADIATQVRVLQIIHGALLMGVVSYLAFQMIRPSAAAGENGAWPRVPLGIVAALIVLSWIAPPLVRRSGIASLRGRQRTASGALMGVFQTGHIVGIALLEGAGMVATFALGGEFGPVPRLFLAVPIGIAVLMLLRFPRRGGIAAWIASTREELAI